MLADADPTELPNEVLAVLDTSDLMIATGHNGLSRGVLLVKCGRKEPWWWG
jgi:hypothetical protein